MNRRRLIIWIVVLLSVGIVAAVKYRYAMFPGDKVSETYRKYTDTPNIEATYIKDFRVSDSIRTDITLLHALDTAGWILLLDDFFMVNKNIDQYPEEYRNNLLFGDGVGFNVYQANNPTLRADTNTVDVEQAIRYPRFRMVMVCHNLSYGQAQAIMQYQINDYFKDIE